MKVSTLCDTEKKGTNWRVLPGMFRVTAVAFDSHPLFCLSASDLQPFGTHAADASAARLHLLLRNRSFDEAFLYKDSKPSTWLSVHFLLSDNMDVIHSM